jgi:diacylglycerol kinase (ATP)
MDDMRGLRFIESLNAAVEGFIYAMRTERNMRVHFLAAIFLVLLGIYLSFNAIELTILCLTITLVLTAEMINTSIELIVDLIKSELHPMARIIKDVAAGGVLVTAINACIVTYILFSRKVPFDIRSHIMTVRSSPWQVTFIALIMVLSVTILGKLTMHKGNLFRGGMPSGHSAVAFAIWTIVAFLANNLVVVVLTFVMAFLIARHRLKESIHTLSEVVIGSVLGILITILIFQIFR